MVQRWGGDIRAQILSRELIVYYFYCTVAKTKIGRLKNRYWFQFGRLTVLLADNQCPGKYEYIVIRV